MKTTSIAIAVVIVLAACVGRAVVAAEPDPSMKATISFTSRYDLYERGDVGAANIAKLFHARKNAPLTWMVGVQAADKFGRELKSWHDEFGDEIGITLMYAKPYLKDLGIKDNGNSIYGLFQPITGYSYEDQLTQIKYIKSQVEKKVSLPVKLVGNLWNNSDTVKACQVAGLETFWCYCWHQEGVDEATFRGGLWYPFYVSDVNPKIPSQTEGGMVGAFWVWSDLVNSYHLADNVPTALHPFEQCRNGVPRDVRYGERLLRECYRQIAWNDFVHLSIHLESSWGQGEAIEILGQWLDLCRAMGVRVVTESQFSEWLKARHKTTPTQVWYFRDVLADKPALLGRKGPYADMIFYGSQKRRIIFSKDKGPLPIEIMRYDLQTLTKPSESYPPVRLPLVRLNRFDHISGDRLEIMMEFTSCEDLAEYAVAAWDLDLPPTLKAEDFEHSPNVTFLKVMNEAGAMVIGFDLKKGRNTILVKQVRMGEKR